MTTILLADQRPLVQLGLQRLLKDGSELTLIDTVGEANQLPRLCQQLRPTLLFLNPNLPHLDLDHLLARLANKGAATNVLLHLEPGQEAQLDLHKLLQRGGNRRNFIGRTYRTFHCGSAHCRQGGKLV